MAPRRLLVSGVVIAFVFLFGAQGAVAQTTYGLTVATDAPSYSANQPIKVSGAVTPAPGPSTGVTLKIVSPSGTVLAVGEAEVGASTGEYNYTFVAGGNSGWVSGTYTVNATWGAYPPQLYAQKTFSYSPTTVTTTTTTTTVTTTTAATTTTTTTSPTTTTTTQTTTSTSSSASSSSSKSGGGVPEFPFTAALTFAFVALILSAYLLARRFALRRPSIPVR